MGWRARACLLAVSLAVTATAAAAADAYLPLSYAPSGCEPTTHLLDALRVGVFAGDAWPMYNNSAGAGLDLRTYEGELARELCDALCVRCEFVLLQGIGERIAKLQDGSLDAVLAAFSVTPERLELVDVARPFYFSSGSLLNVRSGDDYTRAMWETMADSGAEICLVEGYYSTQALKEAYPQGNWSVLALGDEIDSALADPGRCQGYVWDSGFKPPTGYVHSKGADPLFVAPYAVAVGKGDDEVQRAVSAALVDLYARQQQRLLFTSGNGGSAGVSTIARLEHEHLVSELGVDTTYGDRIEAFLDGGLDSAVDCNAPARKRAATGDDASAGYLPTSYAPGSCAVAASNASALGLPTASLRIGMTAADKWPVYNTSIEAGADLSTLEGALAKELCDALCVRCEIVPLAAITARIPALQEGTADVVLAAFSVTSDRLEQVDVVRPFYYSAGTQLIAPAGGDLSNATWEEAMSSGKPVCIHEGYYSLDDVTTWFSGAQWEVLPNRTVMNERLTASLAESLAEPPEADPPCAMYVDDSTFAPRSGWAASAGASPLYEQPLGIALAKGNDVLRHAVSGVLVDLFVSRHADGAQAIAAPTSGAGPSVAAPGGNVPSSVITAIEAASTAPALGMFNPYVHNLEAFLTGYVDSDFVCAPERWALIGDAAVSAQGSV